MKHVCVSALALSLVSTFAAAAPPAPQSLRDTLLQDGMSEIADGLFAKTTGDGESYVAVGENAQGAMRAKLIEIRSRTPQLGADSTAVIDDLILRVNPPHPMLGQVVFKAGDCNGENAQGIGPFHAQAGAGGGFGGGAYGASGYAVNTDTSATPVNTTNYVHVLVMDSNGNALGEQTVTQHGTTMASANTYTTAAKGCDASSAATLTCPGHSTASVSAIAFNHQLGCIRN